MGSLVINLSLFPHISTPLSAVDLPSNILSLALLACNNEPILSKLKIHNKSDTAYK